jgi:hypothetical protein
LKNKEARFCDKCKHLGYVPISPPGNKRCMHPVLVDASGTDGPACYRARKNPDLCGKIGRYWEPRK